MRHQHTYRAPQIGILLLAIGLLGGCESSQPKAQWAGADELGFGEDARDPTERDKEGGWYRLRPRDEPLGTASPNDPDRRTHGFGGANNPG